ncbi:C-type lectin domain family 4 member A-like [Alexandromys fortis]|uniref:C-type lectin domain family 4 member A-like n=1 Tax=Alexandromys fortis TaxID=100897 RepID=UPI0021531B09|nr:C-type lectin domain family 4 member A-like [Microtus fortis]
MSESGQPCLRVGSHVLECAGSESLSSSRAYFTEGGHSSSEGRGRFSENIYINMNLKNKFSSSDINADPPPAPQNKIMSLKGSHRCKIILTSFIIFFLLLKILLSIVLLILFKKYSQLLEEKAIIKELNFTGLECTKRHSLLKDKVWSCCPKDWEPFNSHCYFISTESASWSKSEEKCSSMGAHLMVVRSREEQDFITKILNRNTAYFIGLSDPGHRQWRWIDQTPYNKSATFWHPGEPNNDHEQCAIINVWHNNWGWNDISCSAKQKSVCQMTKIYL